VLDLIGMHKKQVWGKFNEELNELNQALNSNEKDAIEDEFGDVLFSLINYARFIKVNPESALERTNKKFLNDFNLLRFKLKNRIGQLKI